MAKDTPSSMTLLSLEGNTLVCSGQWSLINVRQIRRLVARTTQHLDKIGEIDADNITTMDSAGAIVFEKLMMRILSKNPGVSVDGLDARFESLVRLISDKTVHIYQSMPEFQHSNVFYQIGKWSFEKLLHVISVFSLIGEFLIVFLSVLKRPKTVSFNAILSQLYESGAKAVPLVGLMSFLIGIVLSYQMGVQLKAYGANIFVVKVTGVAILREFSPLITAIIMAGRTSTAFASMIGAMKVNEEIDALKTMGKNTIATLVLPRCFALVIALPLLVVWSSICAIAGSMFMSNIILDISYSSFMQSFPNMIGVKQYVLGMLKVPFFAVFITIVGCFQGLTTKMSAESVGQQTTKAAVQSIFLIIIIDAGFSILYSVMGV